MDFSWVRQGVEWLRDSIRAPFYRVQYLRYLESRHRYVDVTGLSTQGQFPLESARVFVDVELAPLPPHVAPAAVVADTAMLQSLQAGLRQAPQGIWQHLQAPAPARQHIAILAGPGYGKTTLFRHIALTLATHQERPARKIPHTLPILAVIVYGVAEFFSGDTAEMENLRWRIIRRYYVDEATARRYAESAHNQSSVLLVVTPTRLLSQDFN